MCESGFSMGRFGRNENIYRLLPETWSFKNYPLQTTVVLGNWSLAGNVQKWRHCCSMAQIAKIRRCRFKRRQCALLWSKFGHKWLFMEDEIQVNFQWYFLYSLYLHNKFDVDFLNYAFDFVRHSSRSYSLINLAIWVEATTETVYQKSYNYPIFCFYCYNFLMKNYCVFYSSFSSSTFISMWTTISAL